MLDEEYLYEITSSEKTQKSAAEHETKTMLYLMGFINESEKIETFLIDVYNDVTGSNNSGETLWDAQAKGKKQSSPNEIGKGLVTLFKNFISSVDFNFYILSLNDISEINLKPNIKLDKITALKISDFTVIASAEIKQGLLTECNSKKYTNKYSTEDIDAFLNKVDIVINAEEPIYYIRKLTFANENLVNDKVLADIFNEIKKKQWEIKSSNVINGKKIKSQAEAYSLGRSLSVKDINALILSRIINNDILNKNNSSQYIPIHFSNYLTSLKLETQDQIDFLQDCVNDIYRMLTAKNMNKEFWVFFSSIFNHCKKNKDFDILKLYQIIESEQSIFLKIYKKSSILYFISCIKGGINNDN